jgi:hypothetical protein
MKPSTKRFISAFAALAFFVGAFIVFFELVQPAYGNLMALKGKLAAEQELLQNESSTIAQVGKVIAAYRTQSAAQATISTALPIGQDISGAVAQIYGLADANHITVQNTSISVSAPQAGAVRPSTAPGASLLLRPTGTIAFSISANGTYEDFLNFIAGFETNMRFFDVKQASIQPTASIGGKAASQDLFAYLITVNTYYQIP